MSNCSRCNKKFKNGDCKIGCELCGKWFHIRCQDVEKTLFEAISDDDQCHWFCKECNKNAPEILNMAKTAAAGIAENKRNIERIQHEMEAIKNLTDPVFIEAVKKIVIETRESGVNDPEFQESVKKIIVATNEESNVGRENRHTTNEAVKRIAVREIRENNDKKGRECNIVVYGIDEEKDAEEEIPLILAKLDVSVEVEGIRRMGRDKKEGKNRLVWVKLGSKKERNSVLDNAKKLRNEEQWKTVYINKDMTQEERDKAHKLRIELKERRRKEDSDNGNRKFVIHRGQIVTKEATNREPVNENDGISDTEETEET